MKVRIVDAQFLDSLSHAARTAPRGRRNFNFHASEAEVCNRLLNAVEPGSYVRPHRHLDPAKDETFVVVRGRFGFVAFDDGGAVALTAELGGSAERSVVNVPHGVYHTLVALESGSVFFEAKGGPFTPLGEAELAPWAPVEGSAGADAYRRSIERHFATGPERRAGEVPPRAVTGTTGDPS